MLGRLTPKGKEAFWKEIDYLLRKLDTDPSMKLKLKPKPIQSQQHRHDRKENSSYDQEFSPHYRPGAHRHRPEGYSPNTQHHQNRDRETDRRNSDNRTTGYRYRHDNYNYHARSHHDFHRHSRSHNERH